MTECQRCFIQRRRFPVTRCRRWRKDTDMRPIESLTCITCIWYIFCINWGSFFNKLTEEKENGMMVKRMISLLLSLVLLAGMTAVVPSVGAAETQSEQTGASGTTGSCTWSLSGTVLTISCRFFSSCGKRRPLSSCCVQASHCVASLVEEHGL